MSEKQLTVAELLARSGKNGGSSETPRRRRHNLEDGGISVAELTGSIPKVAAKPAESKHSSQPIDVPASSAASSSTGEPDSVAQGSRTQPAAFTDPASHDPAPFADAFPTTSRTQAIKRDAAFNAVKGQSEKTQERQAATQAEELLAANNVETPVGPEAPVAETPSKEQTIVLSVVDEKDPVRLTTDSFPAVSKDSDSEAVQVAADSLGMAAVAPAEVADTPPAEPVNAAEETSTFAVVEDEDEAFYDVEDDYEDYEDAEEFDDEYDEYDEYYEEDEEEEQISAMGVIFMALAGIVLGVVIFLGFQQLWGALSKAIVAALAVAVTGAIVGVVHALRTERDRESMILAGVAGLVMTFGPLLVS
ncbi:DUF2157 domain-containing protein [Corynebacterium silvaticum]|uniref:DUF2157 domain-containing protein n=1 Tax=Corynebacterium silvaticum TaxID=2320431 RepID=A0A7Y4P9U5_9CORY|nr:DUF2157 domain-containing protein [Corynebacterium silvaticum]ARU45439.1 DUF2157 domain-containing protein [Corynebacterium silvaticum]MBH5300011.1 DUF2157 domain-containing protein [Corynebacterium silvaticum]NOM65464.1 DUF2157 domain-containing protein [Corynebacterium silvaticum]NON70621.1 DUF2157 domain-containing protein [Corynebacterium silvaticum]TFA92336.1 DUF2157 domain-containing protein [Corynebacterium silvaticum]